MRYRNFRASLELRHETDEERNNRAVEALIGALTSDLKNLPQEGKIETYLICLALSQKFQLSLGEVSAEEFSLLWINGALRQEISFPDFELLLSELPEILRLKYPAVENIRRACIQLIPQIKNAFRVYDPNAWREFVNLQYVLNMLKTFDEYEHY